MSFPRYEKYKDSGVEWLGEVPEHWDVKKLKQITEIKGRIGFRGYTVGDLVGSEEGALVLGAANLSNYGKVDLNKKTYISWEKYYESPEIQVEINDIVMGQRGTCGRPIAIDINLGPTTINPSLVLLKTEKTDNSRFLCYWLMNSFIISSIENLINSTAVPMLSQEQIGNFAALCPHLNEKNLIASFLDRETAKIDDLITEQQKLIELLKEKRQAVISHAVTKGLNPNAKMKDSGIEWLGEVPEHWEINKLCHVAWVRARLGWKGLKAEEYIENGYALLSTPNIKDKEIDFENVNYISKERYDESPEIKLSEGDILLVKDGSTLGIVNVLKKLFKASTVNSSIAVITPNEIINSIYLFYQIKGSFIQNTIQRIKGGMGVPHLFQSDLNKFCILCPPLNEQKNIAAYLEKENLKFDNLINDATKMIHILQERRTALISAAVTGKIDVRGFVPDSESGVAA